ncbi:thiamine pyrophosphate-binding protein [Pelagibacterium sp.]|uniref:thiamine pyrophosphate-binding protein n=1 Tax=Pelagibacterium sp. TaxID=1967288 RepID=UPI003A95234A
MNRPRTYDILADAFAAEQVDAVFALCGDANMHWVSALIERHGTRVIHARHENSACSMAIGYARASGRPGVASVTCGPGFTQLITALTTAARGNIPLVVFAGDNPIASRWSLQDIDLAPLARASGAHFIACSDNGTLLRNVRDAFYIARFEQRPVVLGVPYDLQAMPFDSDSAYEPSSAVIPDLDRMIPNPAIIEQAADLIHAAERPIIVAGRGVMDSGARDAVRALAKQCGALLANTLHARCMFDDDPYAIGIAGGFSTDLGHELFAEADLVIGIGAMLGNHTAFGGKLYANAKVIQVNTNPKGISQGIKVADLHVRSDALEGAQALEDALRKRGPVRIGFRTEGTARRIRTETEDSLQFTIDRGTVDPRAIIREIDRVVPKDWYMVGGSGHSAYFTVTHMRDRPPELFQMTRDFGAIGSSLSHAIGAAVVRRDGRIVLIDGDGGMLMNISELETIRRHGLKMLIVVLNDGAFGAELHKLLADGQAGEMTIFGREDFARLADGFRLRGATICEEGQCADLFAGHLLGETAEVWDVHVSRNVVSPYFRRAH